MTEKNRLIAILCVLILILGTSMSGCAKKVKFEGQNTTKNNKIRITIPDEVIPDGFEVTVGENGESYLVDSENESYVYDAVASTIIPFSKTKTNPKSKTTTTTTSTKSTQKTKKTIRTIPTEKPTSTTTSQQEKVLAVLASKRQNIDDKAANYLDNYNVKTLEVKFANGGKEWAVKLFKGKYDTSTIGCETCIYVKEVGHSNFQEADDADRKNVSMTMWYEVNDESYAKAEAPQKSCWWSYIIQNGSLYGGNLNSVVMRTVITMNTAGMAEAFCDALEEKGIKYGSVAGYQSAGQYSIDGRTVTIVW